MIGSLADFLHLQKNTILQDIQDNKHSFQNKPINIIKKRGKSSYNTYTPTDKSELILKYQQKNLLQKKSIKNTINKDQSLNNKKYQYQHRSFFVKPEASKDYIAKQQLKRKHNLLRAILRMKQSQEQPKGDTDYQKSFQRLYSGFKNISPTPQVINNLNLQLLDKNQKQQIFQIKKIINRQHVKNRNKLSNTKRIQYQHCLSWAKKHKKNGQYFARQLGKSKDKLNEEDMIINRSLIDQIGKKLDYSLLNQ